jgi:hypothetical protein
MLISKQHISQGLEKLGHEMLHLAFYYCKFSKMHNAEQYQQLSGDFSNEFPLIIKILEEKALFQLLKVGSYCEVQTQSFKFYQNFLRRLEHFFGGEEEICTLPGSFEASEYSSWIGTLMDVIMRFSCAALRYITSIFSELNIDLKKKLISSNKK